jgi:hypothetical protein
MTNDDGVKLRAISLGAGVQSSTMALMAARGEIGPMPDFAIFADTGWEPKAIYEYLDWIETQLPFPVIRARRPGDDLAQHSIKIAHNNVTRTASPPWFTDHPKGMLPKQCSKEFKIRVIGQQIRKLLGLKRGQSGPKTVVVEQWIGIFIRRNAAHEGQRAEVCQESLAACGDADEPPRLPRMDDGPAISKAIKIVLHFLPVPRRQPMARYAEQSSR